MKTPLGESLKALVPCILLIAGIGALISTFVRIFKSGTWSADPGAVQWLYRSSGCEQFIGESGSRCYWFGVALGYFDATATLLYEGTAAVLLFLGFVLLARAVKADTKPRARAFLLSLIVIAILIIVGAVVTGYIYRTPPAI
jgi:hypothetical protein